MKTDRELLELAAKAAGICLDWEWDGPPDQWQPWYYEGKTLRNWNPLTDDGDALRLAVKLNIDFYLGNDDGAATFAGYFIGTVQKFAIVQHSIDPYAATRRAIVRAAAELGSQS